MSEGKSNPKVIIATSVAVLLLFGMAYAFPMHFWGVNFHAYLPIWVAVLAVGVPLLLTQGIVAVQDRLSKLGKVPNWVWSGAVAVVMGLLFYNFVIQTDLYGDTRALLAALGPGGKSHDKYWIWGALSPNILGSKNGELFSYSLADGIQKLIGCSVAGAFRILAATLGAIYAFVWMEFVLHKFKTPLLRVVVAALGLLAGFTQVFYGHAEVYAAPLLLFTSYLIALVHCVTTRKRAWLVMAGLLLLLGIRAHSAGFALVPTFVYALLVVWAGDHAGRQSWLRWRRAGGLLPLAAIGIGITCYFTIFQGGAEKVAKDGTGFNVFLKIVPDGTAENVYAMASPWHLWDFVQVALLGSAAGVAVLLAVLVGLGRREKWNSPAEIVVTMAFILLGALFFAIDPWLTMPRDWDLMLLCTPPLLLIAALYLAKNEATLSRAWLPAGLLLAIAAFQVCAVPVNVSSRKVHLRLMDLGQHSFITGHGGGMFYFRHALNEEAFPVQERAAILDATYKTLLPHVTKHNGSEFAFLCQFAGITSFEVGNYQQALVYFNAALDRSPEDFLLYEDLASVEYKLGRFQSSLNHAMFAINHGSSRSSNWGVAFLAAVELRLYPLALQIGDDYLARFGDPDHLGDAIEAVRESE